MIKSYISNIQVHLSWKSGLKWLLIIYLIPKFIFLFPSLGLDASWIIGLNLAIKENLVWGTDIVFTYGPLGYLLTSLPVFTSKVAIFLFYIFIVGNGIYFIHYFLKSIGNTRDYLYSILILVFFGTFLFSKMISKTFTHLLGYILFLIIIL